MNSFLPLALKTAISTCALFISVKWKKIIFNHCSLQEADFTETNLTAAIFSNCDLQDAKFDHSNLEKADLRTSFNYSIDPEVNKIKKGKFSLPSVIRLLDKYDIIVEQ